MSFARLGELRINSVGQNAQLIHLPDENDDLQPFLSWGYEAQSVPTEGSWIQTPDLHAAPYNVPEEATAVRLHIKVKAKTITWTAYDSIGDIQVAVKTQDQNVSSECIHATANQKANTNLPGEQISHTQVDVQIFEDGKVDIFHYPAVINYATVDLIVYLAGYWAITSTE